MKAHELRSKSEAELQKSLESCKDELAQLRASKVSGTAAKLAGIKPLRKDIARILLVLTEKARAQAREDYSKKSRKPINLRRKLSHKLRLQLTKGQQNKKSLRVMKKSRAAAPRKYAVIGM